MLAKTKLNGIEPLLFKALIDSNISPDEFVFINNVLRDCTLSIQEEVEGWVRVFPGTRKYSRQILMGKEKFLNFFDGTQKSFLRASFLLFFLFSFCFYFELLLLRSYGDLTTKCSNQSSRGFLKKQGLFKNKKNPYFICFTLFLQRQLD